MTTSPRFNVDAALQRMRGNEELFRTLVAFFLDDYAELLDQLQQGLAARDADQVSRQAHILAGAAGNFDAHAVAERAEQVERLAGRGELDRIDPVYRDLAREVHKLVEELTAYRPAEGGRG